jgi:hypothetical protein
VSTETGGIQGNRAILERTGAGDIFKAPMFSGGVPSPLRIGSDVDARLETSVGYLYMFGGSLVPENGRVEPTLTLLCLAKYLADILPKPVTRP